MKEISSLILSYILPNTLKMKTQTKQIINLIIYKNLILNKLNKNKETFNGIRKEKFISFFFQKKGKSR